MGIRVSYGWGGLKRPTPPGEQSLVIQIFPVDCFTASGQRLNWLPAGLGKPPRFPAFLIKQDRLGQAGMGNDCKSLLISSLKFNLTATRECTTRNSQYKCNWQKFHDVFLLFDCILIAAHAQTERPGLNPHTRRLDNQAALPSIRTSRCGKGILIALPRNASTTALLISLGT